ncbi:MAG TPA: glutathione S-transferase family protein [Candidatus Binatus sp.]|jgi:glutathione S-transferase|uniref:glutathione S-transferase family protein n=1 Tax=Candidatus Binatus sp. TaxID=2811406 RepID=UPI002F42C87B
MTKLHGTSRSRSARSLWALEELGVSYEHLPMPTTEAKSPAHLKLNPNGHVPVLEDDGVVVWESMAINLYLADKYGKNSLWPSDAAGRAGAYKWSFWAMTEVEPQLLTILRNRVMNPPDQRDEKAAQAAVEALKAPMNALEESLKGKEYLLGKNFTIADLNVAAVMSWIPMMKLDLSSTPSVAAWLQKCLGRDANKKVRGLK